MCRPISGSLELRATIRRDEIECRAINSTVVDIFRAKLRLGAAPECDHAPRRNFAEVRHALIVSVQHRNRGVAPGTRPIVRHTRTAPRQILDQFALSQRNFIKRREKFQMLHSHARNQAHIRRNNPRQPRQFPSPRHSQLNDYRLVLVLKLKQRQRQAVLVIQIAGGF